MTDKIRVYISGKITGTDDYIERFEVVEHKLIEQGYETCNPAQMLSLLPTSTTHKEYMVVSYALMDICDAIYLMNGWRDSKGAVMEYDYAIEKGLIIMEEEEGKII